MAGKVFVFGFGIFRQTNFYKLDLFELMLADQPARVAAVTAGLATKTRRVGGVVFREIGRVENLFRMVIRNRNFGRRDQRKAAFVLYVKQVVLKFRQLVRAKKRGSIYQKRRQSLGVTVLSGMNVEHEVNESP